jgi:hypothetical protein
MARKDGYLVEKSTQYVKHFGLPAGILLQSNGIPRLSMMTARLARAMEASSGKCAMGV